MTNANNNKDKWSSNVSAFTFSIKTHNKNGNRKSQRMENKTKRRKKKLFGLTEDNRIHNP